MDLGQWGHLRSAYDLFLYRPVSTGSIWFPGRGTSPQSNLSPSCPVVRWPGLHHRHRVYLLGTGPGLPARHRATSSGLDTSRPGVVVFITVRGRWVDMGTWRYLWPLCAVAYQWKTIDGLTTTRDIYIPIVTEFTLIDTNSLHKQNKIELSVLIYFISLNSQHIKSSKHISDAYISIYSCVTWW